MEMRLINLRYPEKESGEFILLLSQSSPVVIFFLVSVVCHSNRLHLVMSRQHGEV